MKIENFPQFLKTKIGSYKIPFVVLFVGAVVSMLYSVYFAKSIIDIPYEIGLREGAPQVLTGLLLEGKNPYVFENNPLAYNTYGILHNFVMVPFAFVLGNTLHIHRWVSFLFILLSTSVGAWVIFHRRGSISLSMIGAAFFMIGFIGLGGIGSGPTTLGTFLFLSTLYIPYLRSFDNKSLIFSAFLALLALHTKAYNVLAWGIAVSYIFLFVSKKKGMQYALYFLGFFLVTFPIFRLFFPLYLVNVFGGNMSNTFRSLEHLLEQLKWLTIYFSPILLLTLFAFGNSFIKSLPQPIRGKINIAAFDKPLLEISFDYFLYAPIVAITAFVIVLGSHVGNYLSYTYEMVVSTFLIWFFTNYDTKKTFGFLTSMLIVANLFAWQYATLNPKMLDIQSSFAWEKLYKSIDPSKKILNSPVFTSRAVELGIPVVDSGRSIYFYTMKPFPENLLLGPSYEEYLQTGEEYARSINAAITNKEYDMIYVTKEMDVFYDLGLVQANYEMTDQFIVYMDATNQKWVIQLWEPNP
ncbi:MAG: hypothetical protein H6635_05605 [Anaerolineales bacterium]|nr:hypothetical protein [Anaerolineales bacterium]